MSVHFISGKPGGGKSLYSVRLLVDELVHGQRPIITNLPLRLGRLNEYMQERFPEAFFRRFASGDPTRPAIHISDVITVIDDDDLATFFTFRPGGVRLSSVSNREWKDGKRPDFTKVNDGGVLYILDEVHIAFNARAWADTGHEVLYYLSQHRKLGDDVICITQSIGNVDKQFRSVAQDFTYLKNLSKQRAGFFSLPSIFMRSTYAQPATENSKAMETGTFRLDVTGLASCYDTAKGVGIHGRAGADTQHRKKGIHWAFFVIGFPVLLWLFVHYSPMLIQHALSPSKPAPLKRIAPTPSFAPPTQQMRKPPSAAETEDSSDDVVCVGYTLNGSHVVAFLSDGRVADSRDGDVQAINRKTLSAFGRKFLVVQKLPASLETSSAPTLPQTAPNVTPYSPPLPAETPDSYESRPNIVVIGDAYERRKPPQTLSGFSSMPANDKPRFNPSPAYNSPSANP